jgi:hypothetical protein
MRLRVKLNFFQKKKSQAQLDTTGKYKTRCKALREEALSPLSFLLNIISQYKAKQIHHY